MTRGLGVQRGYGARTILSLDGGRCRGRFTSRCWRHRCHCHCQNFVAVMASMTDDKRPGARERKTDRRERSWQIRASRAVFRGWPTGAQNHAFPDWASWCQQRNQISPPHRPDKSPCFLREFDSLRSLIRHFASTSARRPPLPLPAARQILNFAHPIHPIHRIAAPFSNQPTATPSFASLDNHFFAFRFSFYLLPYFNTTPPKPSKCVKLSA